MADLDAIFRAADVTGYLHARDLDNGNEVSHRGDELVVTASTFKVPVLVELFRQADAGKVDLREQVTVPVEGRANGPTGLSVMADPVTLSWRDLALWMIVVSDNAATDVVCERVGLDRVNASMAQLGLSDTKIPYDCKGLFATMVEDAGVASIAEFPTEVSPEVQARLRSERPAETMHTTPRDMTRLIELIVSGQAASPEACAQMHTILARQVWPHRLASGFPERDVATGGKTGTLMTWRNEVGFVVGPDERYAVAVYTQARQAAVKNAAADAVIGAAARVAVDELRARR